MWSLSCTFSDNDLSLYNFMGCIDRDFYLFPICTQARCISIILPRSDMYSKTDSRCAGAAFFRPVELRPSWRPRVMEQRKALAPPHRQDLIAQLRRKKRVCHQQRLDLQCGRPPRLGKKSCSEH
jgi:hypothetical protein